MDLFYSIVIYFPVIGPIILTLMGAIFATRSLEPRRKKYIWRIAFVVIGLITVLCAVYSANKAQEVLRGGDFCYFTPVLGSQQSEGFKIMSWNPSRVPMYDVYLRIRSADDVQSNPVQIEVGNIPPTIKEMNFRLPFGYYQIDIRNRYNNRKLTEMLRLMPFHGEIGLSYRVTDFYGNELIKYTQPDDFPGAYPTEGARAPLPPPVK